MSMTARRPWRNFFIGLFFFCSVFDFSLDKFFLTRRAESSWQISEPAPDSTLSPSTFRARSNHTEPPDASSTNASTLVSQIEHTSGSNYSAAHQNASIRIAVAVAATPVSPPFPRWSGGIGVASLVEGIRAALQARLMFDRAHSVYIIDERARLYKSTVPRPPNAHVAPWQRGLIMEDFFVDVLNFIRNETLADNHLFLKYAIRQGGLAFVANHADSKLCSATTPYVDTKRRPITNVTVPIFTLSAPLECAYAFPVPTYETIKHASNAWAEVIPLYHVKYPWLKKERRAVWRGQPTGDQRSERNTRILLCAISEERADLIDAKLTGSRHFDGGFNESRYLGPKMPMADFQNYRAIVDVDGHSWSSRFGELLCYSSVVVKVQPLNVDYFHPQLQPWEHYIPVKSDLSDLLGAVEFAVSDDPMVRQIVANANQWCLQHLSMDTLVHDMAHIWDEYASHLYEADQSWGATWLTTRPQLLQEFNFTLVG